ncbi:DedA family protein [Providencia rettgeri]|uniref:DedA family protein n=1 Tax=Providencia rettgeri TaxID=587 RepID=UPI00235ED8CB|nr:DedA family protein [Providencia rettgeri]
MSEALSHWIIEYGYLAVFLGSMIEGETVAFLSGIAAHNQLLSYPQVVIAGSLGGIVSDNVLFFIGRYFGAQILPKLHSQKDKIVYAQEYIQKNENWVVIGIRFAYGLRTIGPIIIGASDVSPFKFFILNIIGGAIWGALIVSAGYFISKLVLSLPTHFSISMLIAVGIFLLLLIFWRKHLLQKMRK